MKKFERIKKYLAEYWGFELKRNTPEFAMGRIEGSWKSGYSVNGTLRGNFWLRFNSLSEIERSWLMKDAAQHRVHRTSDSGSVKPG